VTIATQATLAALLAKVIAAPSTEAKQDTGNSSLATIVTQTSSLATAAGQTSTGTKLDTLHTDLTGTLTARAASSTVTGTLAALNATVDGTADLSAYTTVRVQIAGTFVGTVAFQVSNDGTNWTSRALAQSSGGSTATQLTSANILYGGIGGKFFRAVMSLYTSGTATVTIVYSTAGDPAGTVQIGNGGNTIGAVNALPGIAQSSATIASAATTNATSVKASGGTLAEITLTNLTAASKFFKLYNKASAPTVGTDVPVWIVTIPANSEKQFAFGAAGKRLSTGIAYAITGAQAITDTTVVAANDVIGHLSYL
jgi:hypothetical protein